MSAELRLTPLEIIFNKTHPTIQVYIKDKSLQQTLLHLLQEVKDISFSEEWILVPT